MRRPTDSPTVALLAVLAVVFLLQVALALVFNSQQQSDAMFALAPPLTERPWTVVTSVYGHWGVDHLLTNAVGVLIAGALVERNTTFGKFHAYVLLTGVASALSELLVAMVLGPYVPWITTNVAVMGISGSVMALIGYLLASNTVTTAVIGRFSLSPRAQLAVVVGVAAVITYLTAGPHVAIVAHFAGLVLGLVAGHQRLLRA
jgi:membrane associated rhomboid family serine protease